MASARRQPSDRDKVISRIREMLPSLRMTYAVRSLALFGSHARQESTNTSDVDLLVDFDEMPSLLRLIQLEQHLSDALGTPVDLVLKRALRPDIAPDVERELIPL